MKTLTLILIFFITLTDLSFGQGKVKNVILLIPDGTSSDLISLARWYKGSPLAIEPLICGMVKTFSADSTIADSAPTATAYATGHKSLSGYIGVDTKKVPHISVLEMSKLKGMSTGIIATCEFMHATPAAFVCHNPDRKAYKTLTQQFLYNSPNLVFTGGKKYLDSLVNGVPMKKILTEELKYQLITSKKDFNNCSGDNVWAIFEDWAQRGDYMSYDIDRNPDNEPSIAEMSKKAIDILSKNEKGFFLMIEGSQVDWAAHCNDPVGLVTDFLAFDKAVEVCLDFAKKDKNTVIIICPDHGNGGISIGNKKSNTNTVKPVKYKYDKVNIHNQVIKPLAKAKITGRKIAWQLIDNKIPNPIAYINSMYGLSLKAKDSVDLYNIINDKSISNSRKSDTVQYFLGFRLSETAFVGWTSTGHTGEDVFLGIYSPNNQLLTGIVDNTQISKYISSQLQFEETSSYDQKLMVPVSSSSVFKNYKLIKNKTSDKSLPANSLTFKFKKDEITVIPNVNYYIHNKLRKQCSTLIVYINDTYYIPEELFNELSK